MSPKHTLIPTSTIALVSTSTLPPTSTTPTLPVISKTYLLSDIHKHNLHSAILSERTALLRLSPLNSPNLPHLLHAVCNPPYLRFTMRLAPGHQALHLDRPLPRRRALRIARGVIQALRVLHAQGIVHADLNLRNVLVDVENGDQVCVVDLGGCFIEGEIASDRDVTRTSSVDVVPPECWEGGGIGPQMDVWGLGVLVYALLNGGGGPFCEGEEKEKEGKQFESGGDFVATCLERKAWRRFTRAGGEAELKRLKWADVVDYERMERVLEMSLGG